MTSLSIVTSKTEIPECNATSLALLDQVRQALWIYDLEMHRIRWANPTALRLWKASTLAELLQRDFSPTSVGTAERLENIRHKLEQGLSHSERWTLYPRGEPSQRDCSFTGVRWTNGAMSMMVEARAEIIDEADASYELRAIEAVRQSPLMISLATTTGHWLMHNPAAESLMHRLNLHNIPNFDNFLTLFCDAEEAIALRNEAIANGGAKATLRMAGASFRMHEVTIRRLSDPVTGRLSLMLSQQDVTRAFRLERRLQKALAREQSIAETQRQFLLLTSHDFRTPLSIIDGAARRIGKLIDEPGPVTDRVRVIREAVRRMSEAVDNTLASASIAEGKVAFHPTLADLQPVIENALNNQRILQPKRVFTADISPVPMAMIDTALCEQVIENLLSNAVKYSPEDRPIAVSCGVHSNAITVSVKDQGIGVPSEDLPKMFARFFRSSNAGNIKGTGVGLHAVRYFMEMHGGKVSLVSVEGKGSTFTLTFPLPEG